MALLLFGMLAVGGALGLIAYLILGPSAANAAGATPVEVTVPAPLASRAAVEAAGSELPALYRRMGALAVKLTRAGYLQRVQHNLDMAGNPAGWGADRLLAFKGFGLVAGGLLGVLFGAKHGFAVLLVVALGLGAFGFVIPDILLRNRGEKRQVELRKRLPDALDMLTICVEAGMGFESAVAKVARNLAGPVAEEFARVLQEMQFGKSRGEALRGLSARTTVPELRSFVSAVVQSSELGISIGDVLREQAKEMRVKRRQLAEERAQKLQVKLLLPLISCLLPVMFLVVLGPAIVNLSHFFHAING